MRKRALLLCMLVMLFAATGVASAGQLEPGTFTITGYTTDYQLEPRPNGRIWFHVTARGGGEGAAEEEFCQQMYQTSCQLLCANFGQACGVSGYFNGTFTFEEWGVLNTGTGSGVNYGVVTITTPYGQERVQFAGATDSVSVWGKFTVAQEHGTCGYAGLQGYGSYTGNAGPVFTVTFTGRFLD